MTETILHLNLNYVNLALLGAILVFFMSYVCLKNLIDFFPQQSDKFTQIGLLGAQVFAGFTAIYSWFYMVYLQYYLNNQLVYLITAIVASFLFLLLWKFKEKKLVKSWFILNLIAKTSFFMCFLYILLILRIFDLSLNEFLFIMDIFHSEIGESLKRNWFQDNLEGYGVIWLFYFCLISYVKYYLDLTVTESIYLLTFTGVCFRAMTFVINYAFLEAPVGMEQPVEMMLKIGQASSKYGTMVKPTSQEILLNIQKNRSFSTPTNIREMDQLIRKKFFKDISKLPQTATTLGEKTFASALAETFKKFTKYTPHQAIMTTVEELNHKKNDVENIRKFSPKGHKHFSLDSEGKLISNKSNLQISDVVDGQDVDNAVLVSTIFDKEFPDTQEKKFFWDMLTMHLKFLSPDSLEAKLLADPKRPAFFPNEVHLRQNLSILGAVSTQVTVEKACSIPKVGGVKLITMDIIARPFPVSFDDHVTKQKELTGLDAFIRHFEVLSKENVVGVEGAKETKSGDFQLVLASGRRVPVELMDAMYYDYWNFRGGEEMPYDQLVKYLAKGFVDKFDKVNVDVLINSHRLLINSNTDKLLSDIEKYILDSVEFDVADKLKYQQGFLRYAVTSSAGRLE